MRYIIYRAEAAGGVDHRLHVVSLQVFNPRLSAQHLSQKTPPHRLRQPIS